ncbi:hypothetical protein [Priestia megaterium]
MAKKQKSKEQEFQREVEEFIQKNPIFSLIAIVAVLGYFLKDKIFSALGFSNFNGGKVVEQTNEMLVSVLQFCFFFTLCIIGVILIRNIWTGYYNRKKFVYIRLLPHEEEKFSVEGVNKLMSRLHGDKRRWRTRLFLGREWFSYVIYREKETKEFRFYMGADAKMMPYLKSSILTVYSKCEFYPADDLKFPSDFLPKNKSDQHILKKLFVKTPWVGGRLKIQSNNIKKALPLAKIKRDDFPSVMQHMPANSWLQVHFSANYGRKIRKSILALEKEIKGDKKTSERSSFEKEELTGLTNRFKRSDVAFDVTVSMATTEKDGIQHMKQMGSTINSNVHDVNELRYKKFRDSVSFYPKHKRYRMTWTGGELANLVHLPVLDDRDSVKKLKAYIPCNKSGVELLPDHVFSNPNDVFIGYLEHPIIKDRAVYIPKNILGEHFLLIGRTGAGKSTVANNLLGNGFVKSFVEKSISEAFTFIDPAQDTAFIILNRLVKAEAEGKKVNWDKVHWIDFANSEYPIAMNLLYKIPGSHEGLIADAITELIEATFKDKAAVAERLLRYCIRTLLADPDETHTILEVQTLLDDASFRNKLLKKIQQNPENYDIVNYWASDDAKQNMKTSAVAVKNRIDMFASSLVLKRSFGQKDFGLDLRKAMDDGHILLLDVSNLNTTETALIGGYLSYLYYRIAETRPIDANLHLLVYDEMARIGYISTQPKIVSESRKRGLALGVGTQRLGQLHEDIRETLINVQDNFFVCAQGSEDAPLATKLLNAESKKSFSAEFLKDLKPRRVVIRTKDRDENGELRAYVGLVNSPPLDKYKPDLSIANYKDKADVRIADEWTLAKAKELSKRRGKTAQQVDVEILTYMNPNRDLSAYQEEQEEKERMSLQKERKQVEIEVAAAVEESTMQPINEEELNVAEQKAKGPSLMSMANVDTPENLQTKELETSEEVKDKQCKKNTNSTTKKAKPSLMDLSRATDRES